MIRKETLRIIENGRPIIVDFAIEYNENTKQETVHMDKKDFIRIINYINNSPFIRRPEESFGRSILDNYYRNRYEEGKDFGEYFRDFDGYKAK